MPPTRPLKFSLGARKYRQIPWQEMLRVLRPNDFAAAFAANFVVSEVPPFLSKVEVVVAAVDTTSELDNVSAPSLLRRNKFYKLFS